MKKYLLSFKFITAFCTALILGSLHFALDTNTDRSPSSRPKLFELELQELKIHSFSRLMNPRKNVFVKVSFQNTENLETVASYEFGKNEGWEIDNGSVLELGQKIDIDPNWIKEDKMLFKVELQETHNLLNKFEITRQLVKCQTSALDLNIYNRSYQCYIPGETTALFRYRLSEKGVPPPGQRLKQVATK